MTLLTSFDLFSGVAPAQGFFTQATGFCVIRQKYWAWLAPMAERPLAVLLMCHIDVAVALGNHAEVFLADFLAAGGELGDSAGGAERPLEVLLIRGLSAGVGVHLGVDDDNVAHCI